MKILIRFPESSREFAVELESFRLIELHSAIQQQTGLLPSSQLLITPAGYTLKENSLEEQTCETVFLYSKEGHLKSELDHDLSVHFLRSKLEEPCPGEPKSFLILERELHSLATEALNLRNYAVSLSNYQAEGEKHLALSESGASTLIRFHQNYLDLLLNYFADLKERFSRHSADTNREIASFDASIEILGTVKLHPAVMNESRTSLAEVIDLHQLRKWEEQFDSESQQLNRKFSEAEEHMENFHAKFAVSPYTHIELPPIELDAEKTSTAQEIIELYREYRGLCYQFLYEKDPVAGAKIHETDWNSTAERLTDALTHTKNALNQLDIEPLKRARDTAAAQLLSTIKQVTETSIRVRKSVKCQIKMLFSLLRRSEKRLEFIKVPRLLPEAYAATLLEISRRRKFVRKASVMQRELNELLEVEIAQRMAFLNKYKYVLPSGFIPQLGDPPFIKAVPIGEDPDFKLPEIDLELPEDFKYKKLYTDTQQQHAKQQAQDSLLTLDRENLGLRDALEELTHRNLRLTEQVNRQETMLGQAGAGLDDIRSYVEGLEKQYKEAKGNLESQSCKIQQYQTEHQDALRTISHLQEQLGTALAQSEGKWLSVMRDNGIAPQTPQGLQEYIANVKSSMICFSKFEVGALALFFITREGQFQAFNYQSADYFLDLRAFRELQGESYIVGLITDINECVAEEGNPYELSQGSEYVLLSMSEVL